MEHSEVHREGLDQLSGLGGSWTPLDSEPSGLGTSGTPWNPSGLGTSGTLWNPLEPSGLGISGSLWAPGEKEKYLIFIKICFCPLTPVKKTWIIEI